MKCKHGHKMTKDSTLKDGRCKVCTYASNDAWQKRNPEKTSRYRRAKNQRHRDRYKLETLTHYGPDGMLCCCWEGCLITDLDMLTLDHINDDGQEHRNSSGTRRLSGDALYIWARKNMYPKIFQTLCSNHQLKKRVEKDRNSRL